LDQLLVMTARSVVRVSEVSAVTKLQLDKMAM
jgi:hypothetical protein